MANSWFRFKQFTVHQDRCAMKVGTDGVLLGALAAVPSAGDVLDIGTGTGVVALMLAQRSAARVDAVEIEEGAVEQAADNIGNSPWPDRVRVIHAGFGEFYKTCDRKYDLIVSNPPYFRDSLRSETPGKALARHAGSDFYRELLHGSAFLLRPLGTCCFILPPEEATRVEEAAAELDLQTRHRLEVFSKPGGKMIRQIITLERDVSSRRQGGQNLVDGHLFTASAGSDAGSAEFSEPPKEQLVIYENDGGYTAEFRELMRPFYLNL